MFYGHAFVDWDDTIAENISNFRASEAAMSELIADALKVPYETVHRQGEQFDLAVAREMGLGKESFPTAWLRTYAFFCEETGSTPDKALQAQIRRLADGAYTAPQQLIDGAAETLHWLRKNGFEVTVWTAGSSDVQGQKIDRSGLGHLLHRRVFTDHKTAAHLAEALGDRPRQHCFVVGNSLSSDIKPALANGVLAFHAPADTWAFDHAAVDDGHPLYRRIQGIKGLPEALRLVFPQAV